MVTRIGDEVPNVLIYTDEFGTIVSGARKGRNYKVSNPTSNFEQEVLFQLGNAEQQGVNGFTNEHLIAILIDRLEILNTEMYSDYNTEAIRNLRNAAANLEARSYAPMRHAMYMEKQIKYQSKQS